MKLVPLVVVALTLAVAGALAAAEGRAGQVRVAAVAAAEDVSVPYWCDWGYDSDERCYRDDSDRLPVGGVDDKVWRAALRFPLAALPPGATVLAAELSLRYDAVCVAPRRRTVPCPGRGYDLTAHAVYTSRWSAERELEIGPAIASASIDPFAAPGTVVWDVTDTVADWTQGVPNNGLLVKLADGQEDYETSGPAFPSSTFADPAVRPRLTVWYVAE